MPCKVNCKLRKPIPVGSMLMVVGTVVERTGKKLTIRAVLKGEPPTEGAEEGERGSSGEVYCEMEGISVVGIELEGTFVLQVVLPTLYWTTWCHLYGTVLFVNKVYIYYSLFSQLRDGLGGDGRPALGQVGQGTRGGRHHARLQFPQTVS